MMTTEPAKAYSTITETPGVGASKTQLSMLYTRYRFASEFCSGKEVLEVACGSGQGLGYLAQSARKVSGGDIDETNLKMATSQYRGRPNIEVRKLDAHQLPYGDKTFDLILLYEAIYYLFDPQKFIEESRRILRPGGHLLICTVNKEWADFNPSPFSVKYYSGQELIRLLQQSRFKTELRGAFPIEENSSKSKVVSLIKRAAVALHLIPKTMKGKQLLKRIFFGKLSPLPREISDGMAPYNPPVSIHEGSPITPYRVLYAVGSLEG